MVNRNIMTAFNDGADLDARKYMLIAAYLGGVAFTNTFVGMIHALILVGDRQFQMVVTGVEGYDT